MLEILITDLTIVAPHLKTTVAASVTASNLDLAAETAGFLLCSF